MNTKIFIMAVSLFIYACSENKESNDAEQMEEGADTELVTVTDGQFKNAGIALGSSRQLNMGTSLQLSGEVDLPPSGQVNISVPYGGFLKKTDLMPGATVRKGQLLAILEHLDYVQLQQDYLDTETKLELAQLEFNRQKELSEQQVTALKNFQQVRAELQLLENNKAALSQKLQMINIDPDRLKNEKISRYVKVISPINGFVKSVNANVGKMINASDVLFELINTEDMHLKLNAFENDIAKLTPGQKFTFSLPNDSIKRNARIMLVGRSVARDKIIPVHAHLDTDGSKLLPGMFVTATIDTGKQTVTALPETAVVHYEGKSYIFVEEGNRQFKRIEVETGIRNKDMYEVKLPEEIKQSNKIVIQGAHNLLAKQVNAAEE